MAKQEPTGVEIPPSDDPASFIRPRGRRHQSIRPTPFAGRIGGNQEFIAEGNDEETEAILKKQPDAAPGFSLKESLDLQNFLVFDTWRQAMIEGWGTCLLTFTLGATSSGLTTLNNSALAGSAYAGLVGTIGLSLFIFSAAPASGGHLNPTITMATFLAGLCTFARAVIYIAAQVTGAIIGGYWLRLGLGDAYFPHDVIPGCTVQASLCSVGELFVLEFMFAQALIFTAFGVGLDPRQNKVFGPALAPILVGLTLGFGTLASSISKPGYTGISFNPARCIGLMTAKGELQYHWVHWVAPFCAGAVNGIFYYFIPPYVRGKPLSQQD